MPTDEDQDRWLMTRFRDGDRDALATIYRTHYPAVYRFALYMSNDPDAAAEVVQEAFVWFIDHPVVFDSSRGRPHRCLSCRPDVKSSRIP